MLRGCSEDAVRMLSGFRMFLGREIIKTAPKVWEALGPPRRSESLLAAVGPMPFTARSRARRARASLDAFPRLSVLGFRV